MSVTMSVANSIRHCHFRITVYKNFVSSLTSPDDCLWKFQLCHFSPTFFLLQMLHLQV